MIGRHIEICVSYLLLFTAELQPKHIECLHSYVFSDVVQAEGCHSTT